MIVARAHVLALLLASAFFPRRSDEPAKSNVQDGKALYQVHCAACHQSDGRGIPGRFPPLAGSDFLIADKERSVRFVTQGYSGSIAVNGVNYVGSMPAHPDLDDFKVAEILTYVRSAWGNRGDGVSSDFVTEVRARGLKAEAENNDPFAPLPKPPAGFRIRELTRLPIHGVRLSAFPGSPWLFVLNNHGDLLRVDRKTGSVERVLTVEDYADLSAGAIDALGLTIDRKKRLYIVTNQRVVEEPFHRNQVVIFRSPPLDSMGMPRAMKSWLQTSYPWGNTSYNHGVGHIAEGPDGLIYVSSGSRTDGGEAGTDPSIWTGGETEITAAIWQVDPRRDPPSFKVFARGIRNAWSFAWNERRELFSVSNGPDADLPEELDLVQAGKHYGFPYQFADTDQKAYPYTLPPPTGMVFTRPIPNYGPAGGGSPGHPMASLDPHSSPAGMVFCDGTWPAALRGKLLVGRFGNLIRDRDVGFDILAISLRRGAGGTYEATTESFLSPLARPLDLLHVGHSLYILEYTRPIGNHSGRPMNPGRILELTW